MRCACRSGAVTGWCHAGGTLSASSYPWLNELPPAAAALNFKDVMLAYGKLNRDLMASGFSKGALGFEFAGTRQERRVMGVAHQAIATCCGTPEFLVRAGADGAA